MIYVALPALNEAESLPNLFRRILNLPSTVRDQLAIFVVNDGSTDSTSSLAKSWSDRLPVTVLDHPVNLGLGQAVQSGIRSVLSVADADDILVIMDADDTHDPALMIELQGAIKKGADIAIASRFVPGGDDSTAPPSRRLLSRGAAICCRAALPVDNAVGDFTSGYRAYRISVLNRAIEHWGDRLIEEKGFACMVELLLKLSYCTPRIEEVPMQLEYNRKQGASKITIFRTIIQYLRLAIRERLSPSL